MNRRTWITGVMATVLITAMGAISVPAQSRYRYSEREIWQLAQRNGYQYGVRDGRYDRQNGNSNDYKRSRAYRDGKWGYRHEFRHDETYRDGFRQGYMAGYREGYNQGRGWDRGNNRRDDDWNRRDDDWNRRDDDRNRRDDDWNRRLNNNRRNWPW